MFFKMLCERERERGGVGTVENKQEINIGREELKEWRWRWRVWRGGRGMETSYFKITSDKLLIVFRR